MKNLVRKDDKGVSPVIAIILMVAITVVLAGVLYVWVQQLAQTGDTGVETLQATVIQGSDSNVTQGDLIVLSKGSGQSVDPEDYLVKYGIEGETLYTLKMEDDIDSGNFTFDSGQGGQDANRWDVGEVVGYEWSSLDATFRSGIEDQDRVIVKIINRETLKEVWSGSFLYQE